MSPRYPTPTNLLSLSALLAGNRCQDAPGGSARREVLRLSLAKRWRAGPRLPNLIVVLRDSSHPAQVAEWWPPSPDRERASQQPAVGHRGGGQLAATRTSA